MVPVEEHELDPVALVQRHQADEQQQDGSQAAGQLHRVHQLGYNTGRQGGGVDSGEITKQASHVKEKKEVIVSDPRAKGSSTPPKESLGPQGCFACSLPRP